MRPKPYALRVIEPLYFICRSEIELSPDLLQAQILDVEKWKTFQGFGPLPGIKSARYKIKTQEIAGSQIEVTNLDGSRHIEEIVEWSEGQSLTLRLGKFSPPLNRIATHFIEKWTFEAHDPHPTLVTRSFELYAKTHRSKWLLRAIATLMKFAIKRHLREMKLQAFATAPTRP